MWGVACSMAETQGLRKLSVAETLAQATSALEAHRVWMRRRMSTAVAPSTESQLEEDTDRDPAQDHNLRAKHAWEHVAGHSTAGNTESEFLETESPSELSKPDSAPPPSAQQWLETLKRRRIASNCETRSRQLQKRARLTALTVNRALIGYVMSGRVIRAPGRRRLNLTTPHLGECKLCLNLPGVI